MNTFRRTSRICVVTVFVIALFLSLIPFNVAPVNALTKVYTTNIRVYGNDRYDTAFEIADTLYRSYGRFDAIVVTSGESYPDALSGSYLAYEEDAPVLLINSDREIEVYNYIRTHLKPAGTVYILGGRYAVSEEFEDRLDMAGIRNKRLAGMDRYETNLEILKEEITKGEEILICSGNGFADNLSVSATGLPILLVDREKMVLTKDQIEFLRDVKPSKIHIIGGEAAVGTSVRVQAQMIAATDRFGGATRYETSTLVAEEFFPKNQETIVLTNGRNFPDGLSGAPLAMYLKSPIILVNDDTDLTYVKDYVEDNSVDTSYTLGGPAALSQDTVEKIMERYLEGNPTQPRQHVGTAKDVLNVMRSWLGYSEVNGKYREIIDLYNSVLPRPVNYKVKYSDEWCDACVTAAAIQAGCADLIGRECGVGRHVDIFRRKGIWIEDGTIVPEPGYIIVYNWNKSTQPNNWGASHIGYVDGVLITGRDEEGNPEGFIIAIEGNYAKDGGPIGYVGRRRIPIGYGYIRGFAAPRYADTSGINIEEIQGRDPDFEIPSYYGDDLFPEENPENPVDPESPEDTEKPEDSENPEDSE